ncbi:MAG: TraU family protein, partial [Desulfobacterales bacterium]|nr:TraU family protein [Desulfobacterales bacterium]
QTVLFRSRETLLWDVGINLCASVPTPIWVKWNYRMQIAKPVRSLGCMPIGRTGLMWAFGKNPALGLTGSADNFLFMVFRKRACCAF